MSGNDGRAAPAAERCLDWARRRHTPPPNRSGTAGDSPTSVKGTVPHRSVPHRSRLAKRVGFDIGEGNLIRRVRFPLHDHCKKNLKWSNAQVLMRFVLMRFVLLQLVVMPVLLLVLLKVR